MRLLLVEDDVKIASFILKGLKESNFTVDHAVDGEDGLYLALNRFYDAAVIDIMLPKIDGLVLIQEMRRQNLNTPVIILSARRTVDDRIKGLRSGSDDYLTKPFSFSELLARIQALMRRAGVAPDSTSLAVGDLKMNLLTREVRRGRRKIELQPREFSLLEYLMRNWKTVVSRTMILEHVWGYDFDPQTNVIEAHICKLRDKIDKDFGTKLIHTIRGAGYVLKEDT